MSRVASHALTDEIGTNLLSICEQAVPNTVDYSGGLCAQQA